MTLPVGQIDSVNPPRGETKNKHWNTDVTVGDSYADILKYKPAGGRSVLVLAEDGGSFGFTYRIFVSIADIDDPNTELNSPTDGFPSDVDPSWVELVVDKTVAASGNVAQPFFFGWSFVRVQVKNTSGGSAATANVWAKGD